MEKMVTQNRLLLQQMPKMAPRMAQSLHLMPEKWIPMFYPFCLAPLEYYLCSTLVGKTELKCTENFKAYISISLNTTGHCFDVLLRASALLLAQNTSRLVQGSP